MLQQVWQPNKEYAAMLAQVRHYDSDVVVFQEADERWFAELVPLKESHSIAYHAPGERLRGMAIFSRLPLLDIHEVIFNNPLSSSIACTVDVDGAKAQVLCTHPWPAMLIGDLNTGMWSPHYREMEATSGLHNVRRGFGIVATHPTNEPLYPRVSIDHILLSDEFIVRSVLRGEACGSDHAALIVDVTISVLL